VETNPAGACALCAPPAPQVSLWSDERVRVVDAREPGYPGYCRVIWRAHVREMSDLSESERRHLMAVVWAVERALRELMAPDKINLASLGNRVPHLHWHVIPRFRDDAHFPDAVWAPARRRAPPGRGLEALALRRALRAALGGAA
jgi:diadenosine tetraphosphate (Ap4A) HIT family hydrolase